MALQRGIANTTGEYSCGAPNWVNKFVTRGEII
jgi:hypothetical protein